MWRLVALLAALLQVTGVMSCPREPSPEHATALRTPGDNGFRILVSGEPDKYVPGSVYTLSLLGSRTHGLLQQFSRFLLSAEPLGSSGVEASPQRVGSFQLFGDQLTAFHELCVNTVAEASDLPKSEVQVMWVAPPRGSGCVVFRAMVLEDQNNWFADDGALSRELCELTTARDDEPEDSTQCCACDEAKYRMVFEGIWSNRTHPKDYPFSLWLTHFSDVIGASHEKNFSFWGEGQYASDGFRQLAEWGSVRGMETELRAKSKHLRTLIKAAGLWYPRVNSNTTSNFKVDRRRPLLSIASMFGPTPDWVVGVSGLDLCQKDCTWAETRVVDLFPYDAGTDSGITYMSPNSPTVPLEKMFRITTMYPEDPRAPFYDPSGREMAPVARLYVTREAVVPRSCADPGEEALLAQAVEEAENTEDTVRPECGVSDYSPWSACSVSCGKGLRMRQRAYLMPQKAEMLGCNRQLVSKEMCVAALPECPSDFEGGEEIPEGVCATTPWGPMGECSVSCGVGVAMRTRRFLDRVGHKRCPHVPVVEKEKCMMPPCTGAAPEEEPVDPMCPATPWSDWSPCSASCGKGVKLRTRLVLVAAELQEKCSARLELVQQRPCVDQESCAFDMATAKQVCMQEPEIGPCRGYFERWHFNIQKGMCQPFVYGGCRGNRNNFLTDRECLDVCGVFAPSPGAGGLPDGVDSPVDPPVDCVVSNWSVWTECSASCGVGFRERFRMVKVQAENGGRPCPKRLVRRKKCHKKCDTES
ncbi:spondin-1 [Bacillus rossius redtenbacheri]|uniref:spondin-1 n=1 Tax=Bacillus rossius redtenbacheri TaxID=93214 RepID=UPI002FDD808A